ncbi:MAG: hypothetical protein U9Q67_01985, partial [Patescibacteria group bacterium]|nr:hypothetical protein [Patescibacteria group bacterium]
IVIGFGVAVDQTVSKFAIKNRVIIRVYDLIYDLVDELKDAALALQSPENIEEEVGVGKVKKLFVLSNETNVLGVRVESGEIKKGMRCKVTREDEEICDSKITSMKCEKEDINAAATDVECGLVLDTADEVKEGDRVRCYKLVKA